MYAKRAFAQCLALAGMLSLAATSAYALTGHVTSVDTDARRLTVVETGTNQEVEVAVSPQATIRTTSGRTVDFRHLKARDGVAIGFAGNEATDIVVNQATLRGRVKSVSAPARTLIVIQLGTERNMGISLAKDANLASTTNEPLAVADLRKGDGVSVVFDGPSAVRVVVNQAGLVGQVKTIDVDKNKLVVEDQDTKDVTTVPLREGVVMATKDGKVIALKDLKQGDGVVVHFEGQRVSSIDVKPNEPGMAGVIKSIGPNLRSFVLAEVGTKKESTIGINDDTTIHTNDGKKLTMSELKEGDGVGVSLGDGGVAEKILVNPKP